MSTSPHLDGDPALGFWNRLETHVTVAITLIIAFALGAALFIATRVVTNGSLERASSDLVAARSAFYQLVDDRAQFASAQAALVTTLPVFRAYMTDPRLPSHTETMQVMADDYREQLKAAFCIISSRDGRWVGSSGWPGGLEPPAPVGRMLSASAAGQPQRDIVEVGDRLFLVVSEPARFLDETLGTLTVGYALDDAVALRLAQVTHSDVNLVAGGHLLASSLTGDAREALAHLVATGQSGVPGGDARFERLGNSEYVVGAFPLLPNRQSDTANGLVLLEDWAPTKLYLNQLRGQFLAAGAGVFVVALAGGLVFSRRVSRPLKDMAVAAGDIASGNWSRQVPVRGSAETTVMAQAFNEMTTSLRHWYDTAKTRDDELRQTQKMETIGRLAGGIAHDFNNLLTSIRGYGELVLHHMGPEDPGRADMAEILAAADRAAELTHQLLGFSRRQLATPGAVALDQIVARTELMLRRVIGEDIQLIMAIEPGLPLVRADRSQIEQVLLNLVVNARHAMPNGGKLRIELANATVGAALGDVRRASVPAEHVCLTVADTGHGMNQETASHIFEPFFTTKEAGQGTGLGLAIVYEIVQQAGGMIGVETEVGRGTAIRVYLPQVSGEQPEPLGEVAEPAPARVAGGSETVLLAEDDGRLRTLISNTLRTAGYAVFEAADGKEAFEIARAHGASIDLLLTDVIMPGMNGGTLFERVAAVHSETRVLFMSGYSDNAALRQVEQVPGTYLIHKPFSMDLLTAKIRDTLESSSDDPKVQ